MKYRPEIIGKMLEVLKTNRLADLARDLGISPTCFTTWRKKGILPGDRVIQFALKHGVDLQWLVRGSTIDGLRIAEIEPGYAVGHVRVLADPIAAGPPREISEIEWEERVHVPVKWSGRGGYAFRVKGTSMRPVFTEGDLVGISEFYGPVRVLNGKIVAAWLEDEGLTVKRLRILKGGALLLEPLNPEHDLIYIKEEDAPRVKLFRVDWWLGHQEYKK
jgi:hypothetical protein